MPKRKRAFFETNLKSHRAKKVLRSAIEFQRKNWFIPKKINEDGVTIAYGPRDGGILYLAETNEGEEGETEINPIRALDLVFNNGLSPETNTCAVYSYLEEKFGSPFYTTFVEKKQAREMSDEYGYIYVIDASKAKANNFTCIPMSKTNVINAKLNCDEEDETMTFYLQGNSVLAKNIVGVFATEYLAFALGISEDTLIINPNYSGDFIKKNRLKINAVKTFNEVKKTVKDGSLLTYPVAESTYKSETVGLDRRFSDHQSELRRICIEEGIAAIIDKLPMIKQWLDASPFTNRQLSYFDEVLVRSKNAKDSVLKAASACFQFEQGFYEDNSINSLPAEVRRKIYSYVYPCPQETKPAVNFASEILKFWNSNFFAKKSATADKTVQTEGQVSSFSDDINKPSTSGLN